MSNDKPDTSPGRHWPRGCARVIRDLRDGKTVPEVIRRHGVNHRIALALARRIRWKSLRGEEAGAVSVILAIALPTLLLASLGSVAMVERIVDRRIAQACADAGATAAAATGNCDLALAYVTANGCAGSVPSCGPDTFEVDATRGTASARAVAAADPVRLVE